MKYSDSVFKGRLISCLKPHKMIFKGCFYHLVRVRNINFKVSSLESVLDVNEFFADLLSINLLYGLDGTKRVEGIIEGFVEKDFIRPNMSPWDALMLFVRKKDESLQMCINY